MKRERVQKAKVVTREPEAQESEAAKKLDLDAVLADIDEALLGIDQALADNYVQKGGE